MRNFFVICMLSINYGHICHFKWLSSSLPCTLYSTEIFTGTFHSEPQITFEHSYFSKYSQKGYTGHHRILEDSDIVFRLNWLSLYFCHNFVLSMLVAHYPFMVIIGVTIYITPVRAKGAHWRGLL